METERSKELCEYLRTTLKLPGPIPEPEDSPEFYGEIHTHLKAHHDNLLEAIKSAYPDKQDLKSLVEERMSEDFSKIPNWTSDEYGVRNTIKWMESQGYLLEFIAAAHSRNSRNPKLNSFVRTTLSAILKPLIPSQQAPQSEPAHPSPQQVPQPELAPLTPTPPTKGSNGKADNHSTDTSNGAVGTGTKPDDAAQGAPPEAGQNHSAPITPFPSPKATTGKQPPENPIASAREHTSTARKKLEPVYDMFQKGEKISDAPIINSIKEAKNEIDRISEIFDTIPIPNYPDLDYRFACEERYICNKITIILAYALQGTYINSPSSFQNADKEFKNIFSGLEKLEKFIAQYQQQIQSSHSANEPLLGNGT